MMLTVACLASGVVDQMPVNKWDLNSTCLLSTLSLYLLHSVFVPTYMCVSVFVCKSLWVCVWLCYRWPPSRWENAGSLLVCVHMYQTQHVFPFQRRGILCVYVCACMCVYVCRRSRWAADFQEPLQQKQALCVSCSRTPLSQDTHTHACTDHCPILFSLAGFLNAYPCASGCQDVSLWLSWENLLSGSKLENTNRRGVTASSQLCHFFWPH